MRPFFKWVGGKRRVLPEILAALPRCRGRHIEPFLGGGAVALARLALGDVDQAILTDRNPRLVHAWLAVQQRPAELSAELERLPVDNWRPHWRDLREEFNVRGDDDESTRQAALFIWLNKASYNGLYRVNKSGVYNAPKGDAKRVRLPTLAELQGYQAVLERAQIGCFDFQEALDRAQPGDQVFADPPYVASAGAADFASYTADRFSLELHRRLADRLAEVAARGVHVVVTNRGTSKAIRMYRSRGARVVGLFVRHSVGATSDSRRRVPEIMGVWR